MAAQFLTRFGELSWQKAGWWVWTSCTDPRDFLVLYILMVLYTLMLCLLCKTHVGASVCLSVCMYLHMTIFAYLHMCTNTCSMCGWWEAKGTFSRLTRPKFDPPQTGWVFLSVCWGSRRKNPLLRWRMQRDRGCKEDKKPSSSAWCRRVNSAHGVFC